MEERKNHSSCGTSSPWSALGHQGTVRLRLSFDCRCVIVRDGAIVGRGHNLTNKTRNVRMARSCLPAEGTGATTRVRCLPLRQLAD